MNIGEYKAKLSKASGKAKRVKADRDLAAFLKLPKHEPKRSKYGNVKVEADGFTFDSKAEYKYYCHLKVLVAAGAIDRLIVHPGYDLGSCYYKADFAHKCVQASSSVHTRVIDVKGKLTADCRIKLKLMKERYGIDVKLITKETNPEVFR